MNSSNEEYNEEVSDMISQIAVKEDIMQLTVTESPRSWWQRRNRLEKKLCLGVVFLLAICLGMVISLPWICLVNRRTTVASTSGAEGLVSLNSPCGDWTPYKNEVCVKYMESSGQQTKDAADKICKELVDKENPENVPRLVNVKTKEKQTFLHNFLFEKHATFDNVWLGLELGNDSVFRWNDGTDLFYINWAEPENANDGRHCVQMKSGEGAYKTGEWLRSNCMKRNAIVCEKTQVWSGTRLQDILLSLKLEVERNRKESEDKIIATNRAAQNESENRLTATKLEVESKIDATMQEAEKKIMAVMQDAEAKIVASMQEAETKIDAIKSEMELMINASNQEAQLKISDVKSETEMMLNSSKQEAEQNITALQKEMDKRIKEIKHEAETKLNESIKNPVPIGFVYVQLPDQDKPSTIWPQVQWLDVSYKYAGLFFRVAGGNASAFGHIQEETSPRLSNVEWSTAGSNGPSSQKVHSLPFNGSWSSYVYAGSYDKYSTNLYLRFQLSTSEVRPRNKAVCIWKRIA